MTDQPKRERDRLIQEYYRLIDENRALAAKNVGVTERQPVIAEAHRFLKAYFDMLEKA